MTRTSWLTWVGVYGPGAHPFPGWPDEPPATCRACGCPSHPAYDCPEVSGQ